MGSCGARVVFDKKTEIGSGGFSHVFRGTLKDGQACAVKVRGNASGPSCATTRQHARTHARAPLRARAGPAGSRRRRRSPTDPPAARRRAPRPSARAQVINKKIFNKPEDRADMANEVEIMTRLRGAPHTIKIFDSFDTTLPLDEANPGRAIDVFVIVLEFASGGDVMSRIEDFLKRKVGVARRRARYRRAGLIAPPRQSTARAAPGRLLSLRALPRRSTFPSAWPPRCSSRCCWRCRRATRRASCTAT